MLLYKTHLLQERMAEGARRRALLSAPATPFPPPDLLAEMLSEIGKRLALLRPAHEEVLRLQQAHEALQRVLDGPAREDQATLPEASLSPGWGAGVRRSRLRETLDLIQRQPGITPGEIASILQVRPSYLYARILPALERRKLVCRQPAEDGTKAMRLWPKLKDGSRAIESPADSSPQSFQEESSPAEQM